MAFKNGDKVKWKVGRATSYTKGKVVKRVKAGAKVPKDGKLVTSLSPGDIVTRDSVMVERPEGTRRIVRESLLKAA